jgi:hypothetical protein
MPIWRTVLTQEETAALAANLERAFRPIGHSPR